MTGDLISRSAMLAKIKPSEADDERTAVLISDIRKLLQEFVWSAPGIEAEPVVRCRDCKHCSTNTPDGYHWCDEHERGLLMDEDYCSYGERRADDGSNH